ncbi:hypothetical protein C882_3593 [Caenispirillum salinarum AK4]|uniref:Uncharacterized protein n=1 Tax=Caenispirillum salinarum AK4 TaxID=1238182 RepID=K9HUB4_9PROT|nr:hypothetical protein C882_3593 [Caenispirillum salinarum AK4]
MVRSPSRVGGRRGGALIQVRAPVPMRRKGAGEPESANRPWRFSAADNMYVRGTGLDPRRLSLHCPDPPFACPGYPKPSCLPT